MSTIKTSRGDVTKKDVIKTRKLPADRRGLSVNGPFSPANDVVPWQFKINQGGVICYKCVIGSRVSSFYLVVPFMTAHPAAPLAVICVAY